MNQLKLIEEFDRYFTSSNGVDVPEKVSIPTKEWRVLRNALINQVPPAENAKLTELQEDAPALLFALHDAWPYVHSSCTLDRIKKNHRKLMQKHGDFSEFHDVRNAEHELYCAEQVLDSLAAEIPEQFFPKTDFDCIGDYIEAVVKGIKEMK
jgi:hypothetical protein